MTDHPFQGIAPEPSGEEPVGPEGGRHQAALPDYVAGDTGTRAVPVEQIAAAGAEAPYDQSAPEPAVEHEPSFLAGHTGGGRRVAPRPKRRASGCLAVLVALAVIGGLAVVGGTKGYHFLKDHVGNSAADYPGPGSGSVTFEVHQGDTAAEMGRNLKAAGVVASVEAFVDAATADTRSSGIQVGFYPLKKKMRASAALAVLVDHKNLVQNAVLVREGVRAADVVAAVAKASKTSTQKVAQALSKVSLPQTAGGNPEGYLFPATYDFGPHATAADMLAQMVGTWRKQATAAGLEDTTIDGHTYTVQQLLTVASLVQSEGKTPEDMAKIARVIYNRIEHPGEQGQAGYLQIDATVDYALHRPLTVGLTQAEREGTDSPYNTFVTKGLPPGPIGNPGAAAIKAALHPADGDWYYYVAVNLATGETKFAHTYAEFQTYVAELHHYCETESASGCQ
ncbi:MAG: endolytic transglycosylase MltG [Nocardioides sp.]